MQYIVTSAVGVCVRSYLISVPRYKFLILDTHHPHTIFTWARMWGFVVIFQSQKGSTSKKSLGNIGLD